AFAFLALTFLRRTGAAFALRLTAFFVALRFDVRLLAMSYSLSSGDGDYAPIRSFKISGTGPPVAQSISSTGCITGIDVPDAICAMQPMLPAAITSGAVLAIFSILR